MVFKKLLGALGVGGPSVDTVLDPGPVLPGGDLTGRVRLSGGRSDARIEHLVLELVARVEAEHGDGESEGLVVFDRVEVGGGFALAAGQELDVPFTLALAWETPLTELHGQPLGVGLGVRTEVAVAGARDKGDLDDFRVGPLPVQEAVLEALGRLGAAFTSADLELGHIHGTGQTLPFYQEIELTPPARHAHAMRQVEVSFLANPDTVEVVLEADRRRGHDAVNRHTVAHADAGRIDWDAEVDGWLAELAGHHGQYGQHGQGAPYGQDPHHAPYGQVEPQRSGPGMGTVVAGAAAGVAVGALGAYAVSEMLDDDDSDDGDDSGDDGGDDG
ncbi:sporulation protein [Streptomyces sp. 549]|uniref:sporulation protein n=1 Tax=Streptomyces sp. 549 TaxID=3049076 RepID=UPI0024C46E78|nr:sporulation protein [Streptomyces sp. 549]MDK1475373.1 sporulation protein [Streptomyces sp. 549]